MADPDQDLEFARALETQDNVPMWGVWTGVEGEDPVLVALFSERELADEYASTKDEDGEPAFFDVAVEPAIVGTAFVNHFAVKSHADVRRAIALDVKMANEAAG